MKINRLEDKHDLYNKKGTLKTFLEEINLRIKGA